ncbi:PepSY domain-containing protein [Janthinobacterium sp. PC23-8]|uniref:PepSY-associated TM helix domain-containing protein n=1 Tax=Janthinobacterium sp. PC23-8 TaxID=2012679 RepID=UPI000B9621F9|nr:PepSY-associated TM helix domain-containing protein [Janthinobacterium sp. PC23-8]OYO28787.1 hypothetical protein CD932_16695 [Janthinobacterium sp. PC23-8]
MRAVILLVHRYVGLLLALFLVLAGITGSLLAWNEELEAAISPQLFRVTAPPGAARLEPMLLHARVQVRYPDALVARLPLEFTEGRSVLFALRPLSKGQKLANDQVFVDPYTAHTLGERRWGDVKQGMKNLMPFVYRLHYSLALDVIGTLLFGIVALLWTLDCFVGAWLTLPNRRTSGEPARRWPVRWWQAWKFRRGSAYKISFNLHRAGGLWTWAMLFVLAWSSVAFNLPQVYEPVMKATFAHQRGLESIPKLARPRLQPALPWEQALPAVRRLMAQQAQAGGFAVVAEKALLYDPQRAIYRYDVRSSHDIRHKGGHTRLVMDADTGAFVGLWLPTGAAAGDTLSTWMATLHMAAMWGWPLQLLVCLMGLVVTALSVTGVHVWLKKWRTKRRAGRMATG